MKCPSGLQIGEEIVGSKNMRAGLSKDLEAEENPEGAGEAALPIKVPGGVAPSPSPFVPAMPQVTWRLI